MKEQIYCSSQCKKKASAKRRHERYKLLTIEHNKIKQCIYCKNYFKPKRYSHKYCSYNCYAKAQYLGLNDFYNKRTFNSPAPTNNVKLIRYYKL